MRLPRRPNPDDGARQALLDKAFAAHSGKAPAQGGDEQQENELLQSIDQGLEQAKSAVEQLKQIQGGEEEPDAEGEAMPSLETGSPSAQGAQ